MKYTQLVLTKKRRFVSIVIFCLLITIPFVNGQNFDPIEIPFEQNGIILKNPLIGGLLAPQFINFDLDNDGVEDVIAFDRNGEVLLPFLNHATGGNVDLTYAPEYTSSFPSLLNFLIMEDFNNDGKKDIFTQSYYGSAIAVYRNTSSDDKISFEFMPFDLPLGDFLQFPIGGNYSQIYVSSIDIPSIVDYDSDGDLDILTFEPGGSYMYLYKNVVVENNLPADTLSYRLADQCWGKFFESGVSEDISLSSTSGQCASGLKGDTAPSGQRHSGSTTLAFDGDGDGDIDLLLGDLTNNGLVYLENTPEDGKDWMTNQDIMYPAYNTEADIITFLGSFLVDVNGDGKRDLIVAPNIENGVDNYDHIWYYKNTGEDNSPHFELQSKHFLVNESINVGHSSHPCFFDYNADRLMDIIIGSNGLLNKDNRSISLFLFKNIGTPTEPRYRLETDDYLGLKSILGEFDGFIAPTVGDLDSDGDVDIIIAEKKGFLFYFENTAGPNQPFDYDTYLYPYKNIKAGSIVKPSIVDANGDGLMDLVLGEKNDNVNPVTGKFGGLNYYKNIGEVGKPDFITKSTDGENTPTMGNVYTLYGQNTSGGTAPTFFVSEGELILATGSKEGRISVFDNIRDSIYGTFQEVFNKMPILNSGRRTSASFADIDNDDFYEVIVGNDNGGLMAFNTTFRVEGMVNTNTTQSGPSLSIYPNPATNYIQIEGCKPVDEKYSISDVDGRVLLTGELHADRNIDIVSLPNGVYIIHVNTADKSTSLKFVKL